MATRLDAVPLDAIHVPVAPERAHAGARHKRFLSGSWAASRRGSPREPAHHTANNNELMTLVSTKGHRIAPALPAPLQQKVNTLSGLSGPAFDREFVRMAGVADHMAAINAFEQGSRTVADRDLQAYIARLLPVLRTHLQQAQDLAGRMAG